MNYTNFKLKDFLANEEFRNWVLKPDENSNEFWIGWMNTHPDQKESVLKAKEIIQSIANEESELIDPTEKHEILKKILQSNKEEKGTHKLPVYKLIALAASISLLLCIGYLGYDYMAIGEVTSIQDTHEPITKTNPRGVKSTIRLKDGTKVYLNTNSSITYYTDYSDARFIELKGEAFFDVATDPINPLIVKSGNIQTKAIGTEFNVITNDKEAEVFLIEGIVEVTDIQNDQLKAKRLQPMQKVTSSEAGGLSEVIQAKDSTDILWTQGVLHFESLEALRVFEQLENWYDVDIEVFGNTRNLKYSGEFDNEYLDNIINAMSVALDFEYEINRKKVIIKFN